MTHGWLTLILASLLVAGCTQGGYTATSPAPTIPVTVAATATQNEEHGPDTPATVPVSNSVEQTATMTLTVPPTAALVQYRSANSYLPDPQFEVSYDPAVWSFDQTMEANDRLLHRTLENCDFRLQAGPVGAPSVDTAALADRTWTISLVQPNILLYWFAYESIGFNFGLVMPSDYAATEKSACQLAAEQVIDTFRIVE